MDCLWVVTASRVLTDLNFLVWVKGWLGFLLRKLVSLNSKN